MPLFNPLQHVASSSTSTVPSQGPPPGFEHFTAARELFLERSCFAQFWQPLYSNFPNPTPLRLAHYFGSQSPRNSPSFSNVMGALDSLVQDRFFRPIPDQLPEAASMPSAAAFSYIEAAGAPLFQPSVSHTGESVPDVNSELPNSDLSAVMRQLGVSLSITDAGENFTRHAAEDTNTATTSTSGAMSPEGTLKNDGEEAGSQKTWSRCSVHSDWVSESKLKLLVHSESKVADQKLIVFVYS